VGVTLLGALLPGAGYLWTKRVALGLVVLLPTLGLVAAAGWFVGRDLEAAADLAFDPTRLQVAAGVLGAALLLWVVVVVTTYLLVRPRERSGLQTGLGSAFVLLLCLTLAFPVVVGARYAWVQADLVETVFEDNESATVPEDVTEEDPWAGRERVNVLLLGGDGSVHRDGVRTDSMILASIDTASGRTTTFSLPRNMMNAQFPLDSPLHDLYPYGFSGYTDDANWMLNAVYGQVPALHPGVLGRSDNEGADALKQAVGGSLGLKVDYYVLVNLLGFRELVDAMGGVTVNINTPIPIGGNTDLGIPPDDYLQPGPDQRLDGFEALWYSRGRYGSDDYQRMERQRCMVDAIIDEAKPLNLLRRYQDLAATGKEIVRTDIPADLMPAFVELGSRVKDASVRSVVFRISDEFFPGDPDFAWMRERVRKALTPPSREPGQRSPRPSPSDGLSPGAEPTPEAGEAVDAADACAYNPVP
jgi:LCP family protein required for cell wall assembly